MRVGTWNLNSRRAGRGDRTAMVDLVRSADLDLLLLQEIYRPEVDDFATIFDDACNSLDVVRSDGNTSGKVGCAILARRSVRLVPGSEDLLYDLPQPERGLHATAILDGQSLWVLSWHAANAAQHGRTRKEAAYRAVIAALAAQSGCGVVGMDTNMPHDWPDVNAAEQEHSKPEWKFQWDLLGVSPKHSFRDVYRDLRESTGTISESPSTGPLALSVVVGGNAERFDRIYGTTDLTATSVDHLYEEAVKAGSDHALVVAELARA